MDIKLLCFKLLGLGDFFVFCLFVYVCKLMYFWLYWKHIFCILHAKVDMLDRGENEKDQKMDKDLPARFAYLSDSFL